VNIPIVCAGKMTPDVAAKEIKDGTIDGMGVARQFLVDPEWITKLMENRLDDIQPCINCHNACLPMCHYEGVSNTATTGDTANMSQCALNPQTMQGHKYDIKPAKKQKKIAVVGGGIGGIEVARIATLRGHDVTIYEKTDKLGGVFIPAAAPSFKEQDKKLIEWYRKQVKDLKIKVKFNTEIKDVSSLDADEVVIATGSKPKTLNIAGISRAIEAIDYLNGKEVGKNVVVIGGGLTGCEIAYDLYLKGKKPVIIEAKNDLIAVKGVCLANSSYLRDFFKTNEVPVHLNSFCEGIDEKFVVVRHADGKVEKIKADNVILSIGYNPAPLAAKGKNIHVVGDACKVGNLKTVIWQAWDIAQKL
ncbi:MAG: FAD-dependent oxidoreductase, partial [Clostridia bacterium]|nr:FAD-dependent oxidoreductase [Clostridia bacterium]